MGEKEKTVSNNVYFGTERFRGSLNELSEIVDATAEMFRQLASVSTVSNNWLKMHGEPMVRNRAYAKIKS